MSVLQSVTIGKIKLPHLVLVYGPDGVGKSTFAASAPAPIFIGAESGTANLDVARLPVSSLSDVYAALQALLTEKHEYKTVVLDSLDWLEPLVWAAVCVANGWQSIETPGYGKGYVAAQAEWQKLIAGLKTLRETRHMNIVLIAHSLIRTFQDPQNNVGYDRYQLKLNEKAAGLFREFVDSVLFANFEVLAKKEKGVNKGTAYGDGVRLMYTERRPAFDAKNRFGLPFELELSWEAHEKALESHIGENPDVLIEAIRGLMKDLTDPTIKKNVDAKLKEFGSDGARLKLLKNKVLAATGNAA